MIYFCDWMPWMFDTSGLPHMTNSIVVLNLQLVHSIKHHSRKCSRGRKGALNRTLHARAPQEGRQEGRARIQPHAALIALSKEGRQERRQEERMCGS